MIVQSGRLRWTNFLVRFGVPWPGHGRDGWKWKLNANLGHLTPDPLTHPPHSISQPISFHPIRSHLICLYTLIYMLVYCIANTCNCIPTIFTHNMSLTHLSIFKCKYKSKWMSIFRRMKMLSGKELAPNTSSYDIDKCQTIVN